jgi:hypothetical protein
MTVEEARERYHAASKRVDELEQAKESSDAIMRLIGLPRYGTAPVEFPGLEEARNERERAWKEYEEYGFAEVWGTDVPSSYGVENGR